jgi:hypothetical protein
MTTELTGTGDSLGERRWPMAAAVCTIVVLQLVLPDRVGQGWARWVFAALEMGLLAALILGDPGRIDRQSAILWRLTLGLIGLLVVSSVWETARLMDWLFGKGANNPKVLLGAGAAVWLSSIVAFALLYWALDRGGPAERCHRTARPNSFVFPQMQTPALAPEDWLPEFPDYLYLGFTNATAFSPTDVMPTAHWAKMTMMVQELLSLAIMVVVVSRAINVLK